MKKYTFEVQIEEGNDEFWEELSLKTGCDEVLEAVNEALADWYAVVTLRKYENT